MVSDVRLQSAGFRTRIAAAFAVVYIIWGSTYLAIRFAIETISPFFMAGSRFVLAGSALYIWARLHGAPPPSRFHWGAAGIVGGLLLFGGNGGLTWAEQRVPSGLSSLLIATVPLWMVLLDWARPRGVRPSGGVGVGILLGFAGIVLLVSPGELSGGSHVDLVGAAVLIAAAFSWAAGSLYAPRARLPASLTLATGMEMLAGGTFQLITALVTGEWVRLRLDQVSPRSALSFVYLMIFGSIVAFSAFIWLLKVTTTTRVSTIAYVNPVVAVFLGWALAGELVTVQTLLATTIIVIAVAIISTYRTQESARGEGVR